MRTLRNLEERRLCPSANGPKRGIDPFGRIVAGIATGQAGDVARTVKASSGSIGLCVLTSTSPRRDGVWVVLERMKRKAA